MPFILKQKGFLMIEKNGQQKNLLELKQIKSTIETKLGFQSQLLDKSQGYKLDILVVLINPDKKQRNRTINLIFLPVGEKDFNHIKLLQFYSQFPFDVPEENRQEMLRLLNEINEKLTIGNFGITKDNNIFLRYIFSLPKSGETDLDYFVETNQVLILMLELYSAIIELVASGEMTAKDAISKLS